MLVLLKTLMPLFPIQDQPTLLNPLPMYLPGATIRQVAPRIRIGLLVTLTVTDIAVITVSAIVRTTRIRTTLDTLVVMRSLDTLVVTGSLNTPAVTGNLNTPAVTRSLNTPAVTRSLDTLVVTRSLDTLVVISILDTPAVISILDTPAVISNLDTPAVMDSLRRRWGVRSSPRTLRAVALIAANSLLKELL